MNIKEAKNEIKNTVNIYLAKNEEGEYRISRERQRPVLLIGAPGIGKTAVMSAVAEELGVGFLGYTITHHTRQSAIGLPFISEKEFGGKKYSVTEYTMSEIVASVYEAIEKQGKKEGRILLRYGYVARIIGKIRRKTGQKRGYIVYRRNKLRIRNACPRHARTFAA